MSVELADEAPAVNSSPLAALAQETDSGEPHVTPSNPALVTPVTLRATLPIKTDLENIGASCVDCNVGRAVIVAHHVGPDCAPAVSARAR